MLFATFAMLSLTVQDAPSLIDLRSILEATRKKYDLPAVSAAVVLDGKLVASSAVGTRKYGENLPVTENDKFHAGSITKAMTAVLIAMLIEQGKLSWNTTLQQAFPELKDTMRAEYLAVTIEHLLTHRSGITDETFPRGKDWWQPDKPMRDFRMDFVKAAMQEPLIHKPGQKYLYSNRNYVIAGAIAERVTNTLWEDLVRKYLFEPLGLTSAGFGPQCAPETTDSPWPHRWAGSSASQKPQPVTPTDNPQVMGPAGSVHMSARDLATFAAFLASDGMGFLNPTTMRKLRTPPPGQDYAFGMLAVQRKWADGVAITHAGSNTINFAVIWAAPARKMALAVMTNINTARAALACDEVAAEIIAKLTT